MKAYSFSEITGEYQGIVECQANPRDGGWLLPAHAVFNEPPVFGEQQMAVWFPGWIILPDYRQVPFWYKQTTAPVRLELGEKPTEEMTEVPPPGGERVRWDELTVSWIIIPPTAEEIEQEQEALKEVQLISSARLGRIVVTLAREIVAIRQSQPATDAFKAFLVRLQEIYGGST